MQNAIIALVGLAILLLLTTIHYKRKVDALGDRLNSELTRQRSLSAVYGRISEQWFPLMERYPYDSQAFRFIGTPVDGIQFEEDKVVFCEFKANRSELSPAQKHIKRLIQQGKVTWEEFNFEPE